MVNMKEITMLLLYDRPSEKKLDLLPGRPDERPLGNLRDERLNQNLSGAMPFFSSIISSTVIMTTIFAVMAHCTYSQSSTYHWAIA
jgi:hypothetical protein